jgi:hypothetical protein
MPNDNLRQTGRTAVSPGVRGGDAEVTGSPAKPRFWWLAVYALVGFALLSSACTGRGARPGGSATRAGLAQIHRVASIATLRDAFNAEAGATRLILLVSPT